MSILGIKGVKPEMSFQCSDCDEKFTGKDVVEGRVTLHVVKVDRSDPAKSTFRCECCQEDWHEKHCSCDCD